MNIQLQIFLKNVQNFVYSIYKNFQLYTFKVYNFSMNVTFNVHKLSNNVYNFLQSMYTIFK